MVSVIFFASLRERLGCQQEQIELSAGEQTVHDLVGLLEARHPQWRGVLTEANIRVACNQQICDLNATVGPDDEVAFFPPVTGG